jgi:hypothetical protein
MTFLFSYIQHFFIATNKNKRQYFAEIYITDTNLLDGKYGHVSCSLFKTYGTAQILKNHLSYMPMRHGPLINGLTLGSVPVLSQDIQDIREDDLKTADTILCVELSEKEFIALSEAQVTAKSKMRMGSYLYSVSASWNPLALMFALLGDGFNSYLEVVKHQALLRTEDHLGITYVPEETAVTIKHHKVFNCTSLIQYTLWQAGIIPKETDYIFPVSLKNFLANNPRFEKKKCSLSSSM